jgi:arylsulfatase A-like enzyme
VKNMPFNRCFVHARRGGEPEQVEEVDIPALSLLDEKWAAYSIDFIARMASDERPWFLYHGTRGAHFDNYPHERFLGTSPAKHPYKDTLLELDDIVGRLVAVLTETGQLDNTLIMISSDNGPHMENWPDAAYTPFRCAKGSTWEGGVRVPGIVAWPGMIDADRASDGLFHFSDLLPTVMTLDGVDQTSFLLAPEAMSIRKYQYYWLLRDLAALRVGEYKFVMVSTSDDDTDVAGRGGFTGVTQRYTYARLYNLYLDPKEQHSYLTRKLAYNEAFMEGIRHHLGSVFKYPGKKVMGLQT